MNTDTPTNRDQRLNRIGVTDDDVEALEAIWNTEVFRLIADTRTGALCDYGYMPLDALDAIWHELDDSIAHLYMRHGLTAHQAFLLDNNRQAQRNLWGPTTDTDRVHRLLSASVPVEDLLRVLTTATSPEETDALIAASPTKPAPDACWGSGRPDDCDCATNPI